MATYNPKANAIFGLLAETDFGDVDSIERLEEALEIANGTIIPVGDAFELLVNHWPQVYEDPDVQEKYFHLGYIQNTHDHREPLCPYALVATRQNPSCLALVFTSERVEGHDVGVRFQVPRGPLQEDVYLVETSIQALRQQYATTSSDAISGSSRYIRNKPLWFSLKTKDGRTVDNANVLRFDYRSNPPHHPTSNLVQTQEPHHSESIQDNNQHTSNTPTPIRAPPKQEPQKHQQTSLAMTGVGPAESNHSVSALLGEPDVEVMLPPNNQDTSKPPNPAKGPSNQDALNRQYSIRLVTDLESQHEGSEEAKRKVEEPSAARPQASLVENNNATVLPPRQTSNMDTAKESMEDNNARVKKSGLLRFLKSKYNALRNKLRGKGKGRAYEGT